MALTLQPLVALVERRAARVGWSQSVVLLAVVPLLLLLLGGALAVQQLAQATRTLRTVHADRVVPLQQIKVVADAYAVETVDVTHKSRDGSLAPDEAARRVRLARQGADRAWHDYLQTYLIADEQRLIAQAEPRLAAARRLSERLEAVLAAGDAAAVSELAARQLYPTLDPLSASLSQLADVQEAESARLLQAATADFDRLRLALAVGGLLAAGLIGLLAWAWARGTLQGVAHATRVAQAVAQHRWAAEPDRPAGVAAPDSLMRALDGIRVTLQDHERRFDELLALLPLPTLVWDPRQDRVVGVGAQTLLAFGAEPGAWDGLALRDLPLWAPGQTEGLQAWATAWRVGGAGSQGRLQAWVRRPGGGTERYELAFLLQASAGHWLLSLQQVEARAADAAATLQDAEGFQRTLEQAVQAWQRRGHPFALALLRLEGAEADGAAPASISAARDAAAERLRGMVRSTDAVAVWDAQAVVWLLADAPDPERAQGAAARALEVLQAGGSTPVQLGLAHVAEFGPVQAGVVLARAWARASASPSPAADGDSAAGL